MKENCGISQEPPFTDRGVVNEMPPENKGFKQIDILIDWFQCTIQNVSVENVLKTVFHVSTECCQHTPSGRFGYNNTYTYAEKILVMWHDTRYEMGVHILLSGSACRELEDLITWKDFFDRIMCFDICKVTRLDIAIDTYKKYFDINQLRKKISDGELVSRFRKGTYMEQLNVSDGSQESASLKFGSMSSDIYIVFYDKLSERRNAGYTVDESVEFWLRTELRFKHDLAVKLTSMIIQNDYQIGSFIYDILYNYIDFKDYDPCTYTKSNWQTSQFWLDFLGSVSKLSIAPKPQQTTIQRKKSYAEKQLSKTLAMLRIVENDFYDEMFRKGFDKIKQQDLEVINAHLISENITPLKMEDMRVIYARILEGKSAIIESNTLYDQLKLEGIGTLNK